MKTPKITIRRTRESDLFESLKMILTTLDHLRKKSGMKPFKFRVTGPDPLMVHISKTDPEASYVAQNAKGEIVGFGQALIRGDEWYLGWLFVNPAYQSTGVGKKLLKLTMDYGRRNGEIKRWALTTFAYNPQALAIYSKAGMTPQMPILEFERDLTTGRSPALLKPTHRLTMEIVTSDKAVARLTKLDVKVRGIARPEEHFFWNADDNHRVAMFYDAGKFVGYSVLGATSRVGPVAATKPEYLASMVALSVNHGVEIGQKRQVVFANGENVAVVRMLLDAGFHIGEAALVMASERFSDATRYLPGHLAHY